MTGKSKTSQNIINNIKEKFSNMSKEEKAAAIKKAAEDANKRFVVPDKRIYIVGGGTFQHVRSHLAIAAPSFGTTARQIYDLLIENHQFYRDDKRIYDTKLVLTKMASYYSDIVTNEDLEKISKEIVEDPRTKIVFWTPAICDFSGKIGNTESGKYSERLSSDGEYAIEIEKADKIVSRMRKTRKDFTLVAFKTTTNATEQEMFDKGLRLLKQSSANLVLVNDVTRRINMIVTPEEARYCVTSDREEALSELINMALMRSHLTFTRSSVVAAEPVPWNSDLVPDSLRKVVDHCVQKNAYKPFMGKTVGHFACKLKGKDNEFLTSIRKSNFNELEKTGLVRVVSDGPDTVIAYGAKPSVGGQSQRIVFKDHKGYDCIVHFHCPLRENPKDEIPIASQKEYECGSHECGDNTSKNLKEFNYKGTNIKAVMLDKHGPNIVFNRDANPEHVIEFIENNFSLEEKSQ